MYILFMAGIILWLVYGLMIGEMPVIAANVVTIALASVILTRKVLDTLAKRRMAPSRG